MKRKEFEKELAKLQVELVRLQTWVRAEVVRHIIHRDIGPLLSTAEQL
jgi:polyphosphate kinase 2 (PPK2 family)